MKILDLPLFADENIHPQVVERLASEGLDIQTVFDAGLVGRDDTEILRAAHRSGRVVLSHDKDFGRLAILHDEPFTGVVYLKPGHIPPTDVIAMLKALAALDLEVDVPFFAVVEQRDKSVRVRIRPRIVRG